LRAALLGVALLGGGCSHTTSPPPPASALAAPVTTTTAALVPAPAPGSDGTVARFFEALKLSELEKAHAMFDRDLAAALPPGKLSEVWQAQIRELGPLVRVAIVQRAERGGDDVRAARLELERGALQSLITVRRDTQELAGLFFTPAPAAPVAAPAPYVKADAFTSVDVGFGGPLLPASGTLTLPAGAGPFPAVVLVHGSGPHDRDETIAANKPFKDLAEGLASSGVVALRYDKRTFKYAGQLGNEITIEDEVIADAVAAVHWLRSHPEVDDQRVFVVGHSLGAQLAPEIGVRAQPVAGVVLLAPPGRLPWDIALDQMRYLGVQAEHLKRAEVAAQRLRDGLDMSGDFLGAPRSYWRDWASHDGVATARKLARPTLILHGERDYQITSLDIDAWRQGLAGQKDVTIVSLPELNHLFIAGSGKPGAQEYAIPGRVDAGVVERIAEFVKRTRG
jgi:dienelactone hydrolase